MCIFAFMGGSESAQVAETLVVARKASEGFLTGDCHRFYSVLANWVNAKLFLRAHSTTTAYIECQPSAIVTSASLCLFLSGITFARKWMTLFWHWHQLPYLCLCWGALAFSLFEMGITADRVHGDIFTTHFAFDRILLCSYGNLLVESVAVEFAAPTSAFYCLLLFLFALSALFTHMANHRAAVASTVMMAQVNPPLNDWTVCKCALLKVASLPPHFFAYILFPFGQTAIKNVLVDDHFWFTDVLACSRNWSARAVTGQGHGSSGIGQLRLLRGVLLPVHLALALCAHTHTDELSIANDEGDRWCEATAELPQLSAPLAQFRDGQRQNTGSYY